MTEHRWEYCALCDRMMVICGVCGNNSCNGGYGALPDGSQCKACVDAYALDRSGIGEPPKPLNAKPITIEELLTLNSARTLPQS